MTAFIVLAAVLAALVLAGIIAEQVEQRKRINDIVKLIKGVIGYLIIDYIIDYYDKRD